MSRTPQGSTRGRILQYIRDGIASTGRPPTYAELMALTGLNNSGVYYHIKKLAAEGRIDLGTLTRPGITIALKEGEPCPRCGRC